MNIHCSACGTPLSQGSRFCPACALPLTAIAMPTPAAPRKKPVSLLAIVICAIVALIVICNVADDIQRPREQAAAKARNAAADQKRAQLFALIDSLNTPQAFIAHCGQPARRVHGMLARDISDDYVTPTAKRIDTLIYPQGSNGALDVILSDSKDFPILMRSHDPIFNGRFAPTLPERGIAMLQCKVAP
jgi:hypothetical protein